ncbi:MAG: hypothetical protein HY815_05355 [Candidatus Riflebacteria bacterium]|nr:hypothetical protein [Candidatus Riflebacteria bacterium]
MTLCPCCDTPHHSDCWAYNHGCSIFGCTGRADRPSHAVEPVALEEELPAAPEPRWHRRVTGPSVGLALVLLWVLIAGGPLAFLVALPALAFWLTGIFGDPTRTPADGAGTAPGDKDATIELEKKAVTALVGTGRTDQLAQAYALFEQRHPREPFDPADQLGIAHELAGGGYRVLGLEAAEKALRQPELRDDPALRQLRATALLEEPAFVQDEIDGQAGEPVPDAGRSAGLVELVELRRTRRERGPRFLLSLSCRGLSLLVQQSIPEMCRPGPAPEVTGPLLIGPIDADPAQQLQLRLWDEADHPVIQVPAALLAPFPGAVDTVVQVHLSRSEARFRTAAGETVVPWKRVRNVIFAQVQEPVTPPAREPPRSVLPSFLLESDEDPAPGAFRAGRSHPVVEIHVDPGPKRLRIDTLSPVLFAYLGRRRDLLPHYNLVLIAKDLVRFARTARVSHGLRRLFTGGVGPGCRFKTTEALDDYARWFWAMGLDPVKELVCPVAFRVLKDTM